MSSPTQRSLALMRERGYVCAVVERWNAYARIRQDLFGFIDVLAIGERGDTVGVQSTSYSNISARVAKIADHELWPAVNRVGWRVVVQGWRKVKGRWVVREVWL